jgi:tetratricopeptide (TPR) repeat protein
MKLLAALRRRAALPSPAEPPFAAGPADYDTAIDRAFKAARRYERHLRGQRAQIQMILAWLEQGDELDAAANLPADTGMYAKYRAFLEWSWALRSEDPERMVHFARLAVACSRQLPAQRYGIKQVFDFRCEAQAALGNALRVQRRLDEAAFHMARARELFELGTEELSLNLHLLDLESSLDADRRWFQKATARLEKVYRGYRALDDKHLAGRTLIMLASYTNAAGHPEKALATLRQSFDLIDTARDPVVAYAAAHNQVAILCDCRRFREAERQLFELRPSQQQQGRRINYLKLRWLEGRIDAGLEKLERAERTLREVRDGMAALGRAYDAALASLDLAAALMGQRKTRQAREVVLIAYGVLKALPIHRRALVSLFILRNAFAVGMATRAMVEEVASYLGKP